MTFQSSPVSQAQGFGVPGERYSDYPWRAQSFVINSALASYNIIGSTIFTITSQGIAQAGSGGSFGLAGLLIGPKEQALFGGVTPLSPTLTLPNQAQGECATEGAYVVTLPGAANIGDLVIFDNTTGAISTIAPGVDLPSGKSFAFALVDYFTVTGAGLGVITFSPTLVPPTPA